jgi:hypothetical protein
MKGRLGFRHPAKAFAAGVLLPILVTGSAVVSAAPDVRDQKPVKMDELVVEAAKTHTLFMGADIEINLDKDLYPVRDVVGSSWVVVIDGKEHVISAKSAPLNLKITPSLKLAEGSATIMGFKRTTAYSFGNDPSVMLTRGLSETASLNADLLSTAANEQHLADTENNNALGQMAVLAGSDNQFGDLALMYTAMTAPAVTHPAEAIPRLYGPPPNPTIISSVFDVSGTPPQIFAAAAAATAANQTENGNEPASGRLATKGMDAMDIEFEISSAKPLLNPYVVTMTRFRTPDSPRGVVQNLVYAKSLHPIYKQASNVHFTEEGFPFNYELLDFQIHIYDRGQEIATNISSRRVELTRDEAFEYVKIEYIGAHRSETLPAVPAMGRLPAGLPGRLAAGRYNEAFFVRVSKDGLADTPYADAACSKTIDDPFLESVVKSIRFKPALDHGKPVEGVATLNLGRLQI